MFWSPLWILRPTERLDKVLVAFKGRLNRFEEKVHYRIEKRN